MTNPEHEIFHVAGGDISLWLDPGGAICLKFNPESRDPLDMGESEAEALAETLLRLVKWSREG